MKFARSISSVLVPLLAVSPVWAQTADTRSPGAGAPMQAAAGQDAAIASPILVRLAESDGVRVPAGSRTIKGIAVEVTDSAGAPVADAAVACRFPDSGATAYFPDGSHSAVAYTDATGVAHIGNFQWSDTAGTVALRVTASKADSHAGLLVEQTVETNPALPAVVTHPLALPHNEEQAAIAPPQTEPQETVAAPAALPLMVRPVGQLAGVSAYLPAHSSSSPAISISSSEHGSGGYHGSWGLKKWLILAVIAGAGAGAALALSGKSSPAAAPSSISVGAPTISVGHP